MESKANNGRLHRLYEYLQENTDEMHPITTSMMVEALAAEGYKANKKTVKDDIDALIDQGSDVIVDASGRENTYFLGDRKFELPELKLLIDAVSSSHFISAQKSDALIQKLSSFASIYQRSELQPRIYTVDRIKNNDNKAYYVVDLIGNAIREHKKIRFQYTDYDADKHIVLRHDGEPYITSPYAFLWNNDFYYLVAYSEKYGRIATFRMDRILNPQVLDENALPEPDGFDIRDFASKVFRMYDGAEKEVELVCDNEMMRYLVDHFGEDFRTERISDTQFRAVVSVSTAPTFYSWVFQFGGKIKIVGPEEIRNEYLELARKAIG